MDLHIGRVPLAQRQHAHIGGDHRVHSQRLQLDQEVRQAVHLPVAGHGVAGDMDADAVALAQRHSLRKLLRGKIPRKGPHSKVPASQVDRVRAIGHGHAQPFHIARRRQQLRFPHHW